MHAASGTTDAMAPTSMAVGDRPPLLLLWVAAARLMCCMRAVLISTNPTACGSSLLDMWSLDFESIATHSTLTRVSSEGGVPPISWISFFRRSISSRIRDVSVAFLHLLFCRAVSSAISFILRMPVCGSNLIARCLQASRPPSFSAHVTRVLASVPTAVFALSSEYSSRFCSHWPSLKAPPSRPSGPPFCTTS